MYDYNQTRSFNFGIARETSIEAALVYGELSFWFSKSKDGWVYKNYEDMEERLGISKFRLKKAYTLLENAGYVEVKLRRANGTPTLHFRKLKNLTMDSEETSLSDSEETSQSLTVIPTVDIYSTRQHVSESKQQLQELLDFYKQTRNMRNSVQPTPDRLKRFKERLRDSTYEELRTAIKATANRDSFYGGGGLRGWKADIDFVLRSRENIEKLIEDYEANNRQRQIY